MKDQGFTTQTVVFPFRIMQPVEIKKFGIVGQVVSLLFGRFEQIQLLVEYADSNKIIRQEWFCPEDISAIDFYARPSENAQPQSTGEPRTADTNTCGVSDKAAPDQFVPILESELKKILKQRDLMAEAIDEIISLENWSMGLFPIPLIRRISRSVEGITLRVVVVD